MRIHTTLSEAQNGQAFTNLARAFHLPPAKVEVAVRDMIDELTYHIERRMTSRYALADLVELLGKNVHEQVLDTPMLLGATSSQVVGNEALNVLAGRNESKRIARNTASAAGISEMIAEYLLPVVAAMLVGALAKLSRADLEAIIAGAPGWAPSDPIAPVADANPGPLQLPRVAGGMGFSGSSGASVDVAGPASAANHYLELAEAIREAGRVPAAPDPAKAARRALAATLGFPVVSMALGWIGRMQRWSIGAFTAALAGWRRH